jgi:hypothetical protein
MKAQLFNSGYWGGAEIACWRWTGVGRWSARFVAAFRRGLKKTGYIEGQNAAIEYHWLEGQYDRLPALKGDLVRRQVAVIATPGLVARNQSDNSDDADRRLRCRRPKKPTQ